MKTPILIGWFLLGTLSALSQVKQEKRKDFEANEEGRDYTTMVGEYGILMHGPIESDDNTRHWNITRYDTDLEEKQSYSFEIPEKFYYSSTHVPEDHKTVYYEFEGKKGAFHIVIFDVKSGSSRSVSGVYPSKFMGGGMQVVGNSAFIVGRIKKQQVLLKLDLESGQGTPIQLPHAAEKLSIQNAQVLHKEKKLAVLTTYGSKKLWEVSLNVLDENGEAEGDPINLSKDPAKIILSASVTWVAKNHYLLSGTYSSDRDAMANGIYVSEFKNGEQLFIQYNSFTELKNFTEYLSGKRKEKLDKKIEKKKEKGMTDFVEAYVVDHPIFEHNGEYIYIGEVYYPTYRTEYYTTYVNGRPTTQTRRVFDGYQYTHSTVIGMDKNGKKNWDFCFEMWLDYKPFYHKRFIKKVIDKDELRLIFTTGTQFKAMIIKGGERKMKDLGTIEYLDANEKLKYAGNVNTEYWYGNYFLAAGSKRVKEEDKKGKTKKKTVFYLVKIKFD